MNRCFEKIYWQTLAILPQLEHIKFNQDKSYWFACYHNLAIVSQQLKKYTLAKDFYNKQGNRIKIMECLTSKRYSPRILRQFPRLNQNLL